MKDITLSSASSFQPGLLNAFVCCSQETMWAMDSLSQCMHTWLLFIYRFPGDYAYQNECSLGNSCKWHPTSLMHCSLKSELWQQGKGDKTPKTSPPRVGNYLFLSKCLTEAFSEINLRMRKRHSTMKLCCCMWTDSWRHFSLAHPLPAPRSSLNTFLVKRNVLNIGQIFLQN